MQFRRPFLVLALVAALLAAAATSQAQVAVRPAGGLRVVSSAAINRQAELNVALDKLNLEGQARDAAASDFAKLPPEAQDAVLSALNPTYALKVGYPSIASRYKIIQKPVKLDLRPSISEFYPTKGSPAYYSIVKGFMLSKDCKVVFDGAELPTGYFADMLCFQVPAGKAVGANYPTYVRDTVRNAQGDPTNYRVVTPMGYRGVNGWKFANFGTPAIGWAVYRDYFTPAAVEYAGGAHRPSAQAWYDSTYKGVGGGGDCYGMSLRSIRTKLHDWQGLYAAWWPSNQQPTVWDYAKVDPQVVDSVREDQGGQLSRQAAALINDRWNHQNHNQAWEFIRNAIASGDPQRQSVMGMWIGNHSGHAVVAYRVEEVGNNRNIYLYDNNKPYSETETNDNHSYAAINKSANTFAYPYNSSGTAVANKMIAFSFNELVYALPLLPSSVTGGMGGLGDGCTIVVCDSPTAVQQITDEQGRTFFSGNQENTNEAARIPDSMRFVPLTGGELPPDYPAIFIFNKSTGKSLTFDLVQNSPRMLRFFSSGIVTTVVAQSGKLQISNILRPEQELLLTNPNQMNIGQINLISVQPDNSERVFELQSPQNLQPGALKLQLAPTKNGIIISNSLGAPVQLNLTVKNFSNAGIQQAALANMSIPINQQGAVNISDFRNLQGAQLKLELRPR